MYYLFCIVLHRSEQEFWQSSFLKISWVLDEYAKLVTKQDNKSSEIESMKNIPGW